MIAQYTFKCQQCAVVFTSTYKKPRKFCSRRCYGLSIKLEEPHQYICQNCGNTFESSENPGKGRQFCSLKCFGVTLKGRPQPQLMTEEARRKNREAVMHSIPKMAAALRRPKTNPLNSKGPMHYRARHFEVMSPDRKIYKVDNVSNFVRTHTELFLPEDTSWKSRPPAGESCNAVHGLLTLVAPGYDYKYKRPRCRGTWKGWQLASK